MFGHCPNIVPLIYFQCLYEVWIEIRNKPFSTKICIYRLFPTSMFSLEFVFILFINLFQQGTNMLTIYGQFRIPAAYWLRWQKSFFLLTPPYIKLRILYSSYKSLRDLFNSLFKFIGTFTKWRLVQLHISYESTERI